MTESQVRRAAPPFNLIVSRSYSNSPSVVLPPDAGRFCFCKADERALLMQPVCRTPNAIPAQQLAQPECALDLRKLIKHAQATVQCHGLFGQRTDRIIFVQKAAQQRGWNLPVSVIKE